MTNEEAREFNINLSFLDDGTYSAEIIEDGINADRHAEDYRKITRTVSKTDSLAVKLAPSGGWAMKLMPE